MPTGKNSAAQRPAAHCFIQSLRSEACRTASATRPAPHRLPWKKRDATVVAGEPTAFFPYVCVALHHYSDLKGRKSIEESILARCGIHVPMITESPKQEGDEGFMEEFSCAVSGELAYAPCCLSNGKIVVQEATRDARVGCIRRADSGKQAGPGWLALSAEAAPRKLPREHQ
ncbi:fhkC [Symbiodinium microadriaticum]|nr:fhkC [Symbiodinium microadriaticum]